MLTTKPGQTTIATEAGLPSGAEVGFQVLKAASSLVAVARTTTGVIERPIGTGNYVINFTAPAEGDLYLLVVDWSDGALSPETSRVSELLVAQEVELGSTGLGAVADYAKMNLGGETWNGLVTSSNFGIDEIARAIAAVKGRVLTQPPATADEASLPGIVLDYLGLLAALQLITAARDYWGSVEISRSIGNDPAEVVTYANRAALINELRDDLLKRLPALQAAALPAIPTPILTPTSGGPEIDELDDLRVTEDPRRFPTAQDFPGYPFQRTGVRL